MEEHPRESARPLDPDKWTSLGHPERQPFQSDLSSPGKALVDVSSVSKAEEEEEYPGVVLPGHLGWSTGLANPVSCCWAHWSLAAVDDDAAAAAAAAATVDEAAAAAAASNCGSDA